MKKTYIGHCHCGAVRFEADLDLSAGTFKCNCSMCRMTRLWGALVGADSFRLSAGEADLVDYQPDNVHHVFCRKCGVRSFGWGESPELGGKFYAVRVNCLDGVDIDELVKAPITYYDGAHDKYDSPPAGDQTSVE
jgi:hypothetical protein